MSAESDKLINLEKYLLPYLRAGVLLTFSGGVDSSLLLALLAALADKYELKDKFTALTFKTALHPQGELDVCAALAEKYRVNWRIMEFDEFKNPAILKNPVNRCYLCKKGLFQEAQVFAHSNNLHYVMDGTNADDLKVYRPGIRALRELGIISPLAANNFTKAEVRIMAQALDLPVSRRPSAPCLATRLPYDTDFDENLLARIDCAEQGIKNLGFPILRLRIHDEIARIEVPPAEFNKLLEFREKIIAIVRNAGFKYVTVDIEGFRSGSMDQFLSAEVKAAGMKGEA